MNIWHKLKRWESQLERGPKTILLRTLILFFAASVFTGFTLSRGIYLYKVYAQEKMWQSVKEAEKAQMDRKIEELRAFMYEQTAQK